ncbi:cytochrome c biogenesis protein CcdA [Brevundimonas sp. 2R-24]|uniref:Cytochrome c biogenesis protein CcdA n=1 Tax=Peiella sedimenti TaxID=3061083 RepID=A0ABT8SL68_9CAUL|nr:cytochrome c biogenesis protein CcdA [Caulobacteraceae bacterium XZ-24]
MLVFLLAFLGGVLTILSPCILPILPFVFARAGRPFVTSTLPLLAGLVLTFALVATLAAVGGGWAVHANQAGRAVALILLAVFGLMMLFPGLGERAMAPLTRWGSSLNERFGGGGGGEGGRWGEAGASLALGLATGLLWAPCAGPILGLILTGAALNGASASTSLLLLAYALGAAASLAAALLIGGRVFKAMKGYLRYERAIRRGLGVLVLIGVAAIALGLDRGVLTRLSAESTGALESRLLRLGGMQGQPAEMASDGRLRDFGPAPEITGATQWLQGGPLSLADLRGKVVVVDFWTYSCINCLRTLPHLKAWHDRYAEHGLVIVGVHAPEFAFERDPDNVRRAVRDLDVTWPVALDNRFAVWRAYSNRYWPAKYFIDARGHMRQAHFGEGAYAESEATIRALLVEAGARNLPPPVEEGTLEAQGALAAHSGRERSPETYLGTARAANYRPGVDVAALDPDQWTLDGTWRREAERIVLDQAPGAIAYRFRGRDVHLVLAPAEDGRPVRLRITLDGQAPGRAAGADVAADGTVTVTSHRLYQLIRLPQGRDGGLIRIEALDPGLSAYAFTFG